jgi:hypothetical protein
MLDKLLHASREIVRDILVASLIPIEHIVIEPLHLILNTSNACFNLSRKALQFLLLPDGMPRRVNKHIAEGWERARSRARKRRSFRQKGFDLEALVLSVHGVGSPLTKYQGANVLQLFSAQDKMLDALGPHLGALAGQHQVNEDLMTVVDNLKEMWRCWSIVHGAVSKPNRDVDSLANAINIRSFASVLDYFYNHRVQYRGCYHRAS